MPSGFYLDGRPLNAKVDGHLESGSYCSVSDIKMSNSMEIRTLGSIAPGQIHNGTRTCHYIQGNCVMNRGNTLTSRSSETE